LWGNTTPNGTTVMTIDVNNTRTERVRPIVQVYRRITLDFTKS
jgi:hypothetical protein